MSSTPLLDQIMAEFDAAPEDGSFEGNHPIVQMAAEIDELRAKVSAYAGFLHDAMKFIEDGSGNKKGRELWTKITAAIQEGKL